jgi:hypothetical protein
VRSVRATFVDCWTGDLFTLEYPTHITRSAEMPVEVLVTAAIVPQSELI